MRIRIDTRVLRDAVKTASYAVASKAVMPVLSCLRLEATGDGRLIVGGTDLEIGIKCAVPADDVERDGVIAVPAKILDGFAASLPHGDAVLDYDAGTQTLRVESGGHVSKIKCMHAGDLPAIPPPPLFGDGQAADVTPMRMSFDAPSFVRTTEQVACAVATDMTRPVLTGVLMRINGETLTFAAADGYRLAVRRDLLPSGVSTETRDYIVPARAMRVASKLFGSSSGTVAVEFSPDGNNVQFCSDGVEVHSRLIDGTYPSFDRIIPEKDVTITTLSLAELLGALRVSLLFSGESNLVTLKIDDSGVSLLSRGANGSYEARLAATVEGPPIEISVNIKFASTAAHETGTESVALATTTPSGPLVFRPVGGGVDYLHLCMPISTR